MAGLTWPIPAEIDDAELEGRLFRRRPASSRRPAKPMPDWSKVHAELKRRGVTLVLLWQEHRAERADGHGYSRFCERYSDWRKRMSPTMRQTHLAGEKLFVDWAGDTIPVFDPMHGRGAWRPHLRRRARRVELHLCGGRWTETLPDWIGAHVNALAAIGGVPKAIVPRQPQGRHHQAVALRARHQPQLSGSGRPLRLRRAADARQEAARQGQGRGRGSDRPALVLAQLRNRRFFSLDELNVGVRECVATINAKVMKQLAKSRRELFETIDRPALKELPSDPIVRRVEALRCGARLSRRGRRSSSTRCRFELVREDPSRRVTDTTVEVFHNGQRVPATALSHAQAHDDTPEHMPTRIAATRWSPSA